MAGRRTALIVANDVYDNAGLRSLRSPGADAAALAEVLRDRRISDFDVDVVHNGTAHDVLRHVEDLFADSRPDDVLLLHFSCHGLKSESGELHFAMRDTRPDRLRSTAVAADYVQRCMAASRSRSIVLLLDCCYGGAYRQGVAVRASGDAHVLDTFSGGRGRAVITASSAVEYAFEGDRLADDVAPRPSVFTAAVVEGLATGEADRDEDGLIGLGELYDYVFERVRDRNPNQTPSRDVEMQGELFLARSGRKRIRPSPMPPDLDAATTDPNMFTRLGAVGELRTRLANPDLRVAVGAHEALTRMAGNDISAVVNAATTALTDAAITPSVHLGRDGSGTIRLSGPPLARACTFTSAQTWLRLAEVDGGVDVAVVGTATKPRHGSVVVKGPTGRVEVPVVAPAATPKLTEDIPPTAAAAGAAEPVGSAPADPIPSPASSSSAAAPSLATDLTNRPSPPPTSASEPATAEPTHRTTPDSRRVSAAAVPPRSRPTNAPDARARLAAAAGGVAVLGALVVLVGLLLQTSSGESLNNDLPAALWYLVPIATLAFVSGAVLLFTGGVEGFVAGLAVSTPWGAGLLIAAEAGGHVDETYPGVWTLLSGLALVLIAGVLATVSAHRAGVARTAWQRPDRWSGAGLVVAVVGAVWLYARSRSLPSDVVFAFGDVPALLAVVVPIWALCLRPHRFALAVAVGWTAGGVFVGLTLWEAAVDMGTTWIGVLGFLAALLAVVVSTAVDRESSDQPVTG